MAIKQFLLFSISTLLAPVSAAPAAKAAKGPLGTSFNFYAWGNGIPGLRLFYADGAAVFTDYETASAIDNLVPVTLTFTRRQHPQPGLSGMGYSFTATPDLSAPMSTNAAMRSPPFSSATLFVADRPSASSASTSEFHEVGFAPNAEDATTQIAAGIRLGGFMLTSQRFVVVEDDGLVKSSLYCAFPSKENPKIWELRWNVTNDVPERADGLPVTLRTSTYPKDTKPEYYFGTKCMTMP